MSKEMSMKKQIHRLVFVISMASLGTYYIHHLKRVFCLFRYFVICQYDKAFDATILTVYLWRTDSAKKIIRHLLLFYIFRYSFFAILYFLLFVIHHFVLFVIRYSLLYNFRYSLFVFFVLFVIRFCTFRYWLLVIRYSLFGFFRYRTSFLF